MHLNEFVDFSRIAWNYRFCITAVYMKYLQWRMTIGSQSATFAHVICNGQQFVWYISTLSQMLQLCFISCLIINYLHFERERERELYFSLKFSFFTFFQTVEFLCKSGMWKCFCDSSMVFLYRKNQSPKIENWKILMRNPLKNEIWKRCAYILKC